MLAAMAQTSWLVVVVLLGCSKPSDPSSPPKPSELARAASDAAPTVDAAPDVPKLTKCGELAVAMCDANERCRPHAWFVEFNNATNCGAHIVRECQLWQAPGATISDAWIGRCVATLHDIACPGFGNWLTPGCELPTGVLADRQACVTAEQCAGGACQKDYAAGCDRCAGEAKAKKPSFHPHVSGLDIGAACASDDACEGGLACVRKHCTKPTLADLDQSCTGGLFGPSGASPCRYGLACVEQGKLHVCKHQPIEGEACEPDKRSAPSCVYPAKCVAGACQVRAPERCKN